MSLSVSVSRLPAFGSELSEYSIRRFCRVSISKIFCWLFQLFTVLFLTGNACGETRYNLSLDMGSLSPDDSAASGTFGDGFFVAGSLGVENRAGVEFRLRFGNYSVTSENPEDFGKDLTLNVSPLTASLIYHFFEKSGFDLFAGAGAGTYLYSVTESALGTLEDGASFGQHILFGGRYAFNRLFFVTTGYEKHFVKKIFFSNSTDFNNTVITVGVGVSLAWPPASDDYREERKSSPNRSIRKKQPYRYSASQEALLVKIYQAELEMSDLKAGLNLVSKKLKKLQKHTVGKPDTDEIKELGEGLDAIKKELARAVSFMNRLEMRRRDADLYQFPLPYYYEYLLDNYRFSPWGLHYRDGSFFYGRHQYRRRFNYRFNDRFLTREEKIELQQKRRQELLRLKKRVF